MLFKISIQNVANFTGKYLCRSLCYTPTLTFSCKICETLYNNLFLQSTSGGCFCRLKPCKIFLWRKSFRQNCRRTVWSFTYKKHLHRNHSKILFYFEKHPFQGTPFNVCFFLFLGRWQLQECVLDSQYCINYKFCQNFVRSLLHFKKISNFTY